MRLLSFLPLLFVVCVLCARAQVQIEPPLPDGDQAILDGHVSRRDFHCRVKPIRPFPGFDLRIHAGYVVDIAPRELSGQSGFLRSVFRVIPEGRPGNPVYFYQWLPLDANLKHGGMAHGVFDAGPGSYRVDWLLRDTRRRYYTAHWIVDVKPRRVRGTELGLPPGVIQASVNTLFEAEPPVPRPRSGGLRAALMVNLAPQQDGATVMDKNELAALVLMLRDIAREPRFASFSVTAFHLNEMRVIYRQRNAGQIDFPAIGKALESRRRGTVSIRQLLHKHGREDFLKGLIARTVRSAEKPDILIFVGLKAMLDGRLELDAAQVPQPNYPIVYLNYNTDPVNVPWQDAIGDVVKFLRGRIYSISRPVDLWDVWPSFLELAGAGRSRQSEWAGASQ